MKTDYQNLSAFDTAVMMLIVIGVVIIAVSVYLGLNQPQQQKVISATSLLNLNESMVVADETVSFVFDTSKKFLDEFYLAFIEIATIDKNNFAFMENSIQKVLAYSDQLASDYNRHFHTVRYESKRRIAGISISVDDQNCDPQRGGLVCRVITLSDRLSLFENYHGQVAGVSIDKSDCDPEKEGFVCRIKNISNELSKFGK